MDGVVAGCCLLAGDCRRRQRKEKWFKESQLLLQLVLCRVCVCVDSPDAAIQQQEHSSLGSLPYQGYRSQWQAFRSRYVGYLECGWWWRVAIGSMG